MDHLERITSQLESFIANAPTNPAVHRGVGLFALYVLGFYAVALSWKAVRAPVTGAWWTGTTAMRLALTVLGIVGRGGWWVVKWPWKRREVSPLMGAIQAALESKQLRYQSACTGTERVYIGGQVLGEAMQFDAAFDSNGGPAGMYINGHGTTPLLTKRERRRAWKLARRAADRIKATEDAANRELLSQHIRAVLRPAGEPIQTAWGKVPAEPRGGLESSNGRNRTLTASDFV